MQKSVVSALFLSLALVSAPAFAKGRKPLDFVRVNGTHFEKAGVRYTFMGTNFWYGMNLGSAGASGNRERLRRELDRLMSLGVNNLRILALSEGPDSEPWRIVPALQSVPGVLNPALLEGLDTLLDEMSRRGMTAVVCLNNFWPWSGGMAQYLQWAGLGAIPYPPPHPGGSWSTYQTYAAQFYLSAQAMGWANAATRAVVTRTNSVNGKAYAEDPTIMAWELANEPRGGRNAGAFGAWIEASAKFIKRLDPQHLVTIGSEGNTPWPQANGIDFSLNHSYREIDYTTIHVWAQNWSWFDPARGEASFQDAVARMKTYVSEHAAASQRLGKPMVIEEFGLGRNEGSYDPSAPTTFRDRYYREVFETVVSSLAVGGPISGVNFWAWAGEGMPSAPYGGHWSDGDPFTGDPPHEAQGWYGVYSADIETLRVISEYAVKVNAP